MAKQHQPFKQCNNCNRLIGGKEEITVCAHCGSDDIAEPSDELPFGVHVFTRTPEETTCIKVYDDGGRLNLEAFAMGLDERINHYKIVDDNEQL